MFKSLSLVFVFVLGLGLVGCKPSGPTDEEIIGQLGEKFMIALYRGDKETAKQICNQTGYETFEQLSSAIALGSLGLNTQLDEAVIAGKLDLVGVKKLSETKGIAKIMDTMGEKPQTHSIPVEKDSDGNWKVAVTKQSFN